MIDTHRPPRRLPRAAVLRLALRRRRPERPRDRLRQRRHRRRSRASCACACAATTAASTSRREPRPRLSAPRQDPPGAAPAARRAPTGRGCSSARSWRSRACSTPCRWACQQKLEEDGSLRLRPTRGLGDGSMRIRRGGVGCALRSCCLVMAWAASTPPEPTRDRQRERRRHPPRVRRAAPEPGRRHLRGKGDAARALSRVGELARRRGETSRTSPLDRREEQTGRGRPGPRPPAPARGRDADDLAQDGGRHRLRRLPADGVRAGPRTRTTAAGTSRVAGLDEQPPRARPPRSRDGARLLVLPERLATRAGPTGCCPLAIGFAPGQLPRHERLRLRRRDAGRGRVAARRGARRGPRGAASPKLVSLPVGEPGRGRRGSSCAAAARRTLRPGESFDDAADVRRRPPRRPLPDADRLPRGSWRGRVSSSPTGPRGRLRAHLVRLGLRPQFHAGAGRRRRCRSRSGWASAGRRSTTAGRWPRATGRRARQVPAGRRRHEGARGPHPRRRASRRSSGGRRWPWIPGTRTAAGAPGPAPARAGRRARGRSRWWDSLLSLPGLRPGPCAMPAAFARKAIARVGLRRPEDRRPAPERRAALLQPRPRPRRRRRTRSKACPGSSRPSTTRPIAAKPRRRRRDLPLRHRLLVLHAAVPQHDRGLGPGELVAGAAQGQDAQGPRSATASRTSATTWS